MSDQKYALQRAAGTLRPGEEGLPTAFGEFELKFLEIDSNNIEKEMQYVPVDYGWIGSLADALEIEVENKKLEIEELEVNIKAKEADVWLGVVEEDKHLAIRDPGKRTADDKKAIIASDSDLVDMRSELIGLKREMNELKLGFRQADRIRRAIDKKGDLLQSFVGYQRSKMDLQLHSAQSEMAARFTVEE